jgi:two-component system chemotaxis response regulator CheB
MTEVLIKSAGAFDCLLSILRGMDKAIDTPIVIVLHRLKSESNFESILQLIHITLSKKLKIKVMQKRNAAYRTT